MNLNRSILLAPGPVQLHPEVQKILSQPMIHHRTPEFDQILKSTLTELKKLFKTEQDVFILTSTGSGGMECLVTNTISKGDLVLALVSGKFGERWAEMAEKIGAQVIRHNTPWGEAVDPEFVKKFLEQNPQTKAVLCQACETSTATVHPIEEISRRVSNTPTLFLVDAITALGAIPLSMDEWRLDGVVAGSQKAIMLPTGLSLVAFSQKAWAHINKNENTHFYFDIKKEKEANKKGETFFSSNVTLIRALNYVVCHLFNENFEELLKTIQSRAEYTRSMVQEMGLTLYSKAPSDSVTAFLTPPHVDSAKLREHLEKKYFLTVMGGQDQLKGKILRVGHMGYITDQDLHESTLRLAQGLIDFNFQVNLAEIEKKSLQFILSHPELKNV